MESVTTPESEKRDKYNWVYYVICWYRKYTIEILNIQF